MIRQTPVAFVHPTINTRLYVTVNNPSPYIGQYFINLNLPSFFSNLFLNNEGGMDTIFICLTNYEKGTIMILAFCMFDH